MTSAGICEVTRLLAPIIELLPIWLPFKITLLIPIHTLSAINTGSAASDESASLSMPTACQSKSVIKTFAPQRTCSPKVMFLAAPTIAPLKPHLFPIMICASLEYVEMPHGRLMPTMLDRNVERNRQCEPILIVLVGYLLNSVTPSNQQEVPKSMPHAKATTRQYMLVNHDKHACPNKSAIHSALPRVS